MSRLAGIAVCIAIAPALLLAFALMTGATDLVAVSDFVLFDIALPISALLLLIALAMSAKRRNRPAFLNRYGQMAWGVLHAHPSLYWAIPVALVLAVAVAFALKAPLDVAAVYRAIVALVGFTGIAVGCLTSVYLLVSLFRGWSRFGKVLVCLPVWAAASYGMYHVYFWVALATRGWGSTHMDASSAVLAVFLLGLSVPFYCALAYAFYCLLEERRKGPRESTPRQATPADGPTGRCTNVQSARPSSGAAAHGK